jgi:hypothetical protein
MGETLRANISTNGNIGRIEKGTPFQSISITKSDNFIT